MLLNGCQPLFYVGNTGKRFPRKANFFQVLQAVDFCHNIVPAGYFPVNVVVLVIGFLPVFYCYFGDNVRKINLVFADKLFLVSSDALNFQFYL
jgi:hypothetical protein